MKEHLTFAALRYYMHRRRYPKQKFHEICKLLKLTIISIVIKKIFNISVIFLLALALFIRINVFSNYPNFQFEFPDYNQNYLIAHHIVKYGEMPLSSPSSGEIGTTFGTPLYFYLLSSLLKIYDNILFLGWINLVLQVITLLIVFFLAKSLFGKTTALIAFILFGLSEHIIRQSAFLWQPHIANPFINLSYLLLSLAYLKKSYKLLLVSIPVFLIAVALHSSVFAILPIYLIFTLLVTKKYFNYVRCFIGLATMFFISLSLIYLPRFLYLMQGNPQSLSIVSSLSSILNGLPNFFNHFFTRTDVLIYSLFEGVRSKSPFSSYVLGFLIAYASLFYLYLQKDKLKRQFFAILTLSIVSFLAVAALMPHASLHDFFLRHFIPIYGLFVILISELISSLYSKKALPNAFMVVILVILVLSLFSPNISRLIKNSFNNIFDLDIPYVSDPAILAVKNEIISIQNQDKLPYLNFFQFISYREGYSDEDTFWAFLEIELNKKLTKVDDSAYRDYSPITNSNYMFVICPYLGDLINYQKECPTIFFEENPNYSLIREVYSSNIFTIHLAKKNYFF